MFTTAPRRLTVIVALLILAVTAVLTYLTSQVNEHSEQRLLDRQLAQVGTLLSQQAAVLRTELSDMAQVAVNTNGNPDIFARWAASELKQTGQSLSLWRMTGGQPQRLVVQGVEPRLPPDGAAAFAGLRPDGKLDVLGILPGKPDRWAYALMPGGDNTDLFVYAETPLPPGRRLPSSPDSPLAGLHVALYLGRSPVASQLLESTAPAPIAGHTQTLRVPFGNTSITIVGAATTHLTGGLSAALPWIVLGLGCGLAVAAAGTLEYVSRRRAVAEGLAIENRRLYREQRGIAGALQHALLPTVPALDRIGVAARYLAGVDELEVGGDWFDVIGRGPDCCVFVVGDVSGRGLPAATTMAALRFAVRAYLAEGHDIEAVLAHLRGLLDVDTDHQFATVLLGELDTTARRLRLVSAGHFPPVLVTDGRAELLDCPIAPPVGVSAPPPPAATAVCLPARGTLVAFSDGLVERRGEVVDVGLERLRAAAADADSRPLDTMLDDLLGALAAEGRKDDTVIVGLRWTS